MGGRYGWDGKLYNRHPPSECGFDFHPPTCGVTATRTFLLESPPAFTVGYRRARRRKDNLMRFTQNGFMEDSRPTHYDREPSWLSAFAEVVLMIAISITTVLVVACGISFLRAVIAVINGMFP